MEVVDGEVDRRDLIIEAQVSASQFLPRAFYVQAMGGKIVSVGIHQANPYMIM